MKDVIDKVNLIINVCNQMQSVSFRHICISMLLHNIIIIVSVKASLKYI